MLPLISILLSKQTHSDWAYVTSDPLFKCTNCNLHFTASFKLSLVTYSVNHFPALLLILFFPAILPLFSLSRSSFWIPSMSHGVLAKLVTELLDEKSQFPCSLGLLLQELITEAGNILLDFLQLTFNTDTPRQKGSVNVSAHTHKRKQKTVLRKHCYSSSVCVDAATCMSLNTGTGGYVYEVILDV